MRVAYVLCTLKLRKSMIERRTGYNLMSVSRRMMHKNVDILMRFVSFILDTKSLFKNICRIYWSIRFSVVSSLRFRQMLQKFNLSSKVLEHIQHSNNMTHRLINNNRSPSGKIE